MAALAGRREAALLALPSVAHAAQVLAVRAAPSWVRLAVTSLDRFRVSCVGDAARLEELMVAARADTGVAISALASFAAGRNRDAASQVEALAFGAKVWFALGAPDGSLATTEIDDCWSPPENSVLMYLALKRAGVPTELHIYSATAHDFGVRTNDRPYSKWTASCADWLRDGGLLRTNVKE